MFSVFLTLQICHVLSNSTLPKLSGLEYSTGQTDSVATQATEQAG
jgi:hypothetical protein